MKLEGVTVLDLSLFLPGPALTQNMADHGARVIKIENPQGGEPNRSIGQVRETKPEGETVYFSNTHRGKESLTLNLKSKQGLAIFMQLAETADVVVESFRPGVAQRLGIDYQELARVNPQVIYCSISAYGQQGPLSSDPAHDLAVEAMCGLLSNNVDEQDNPVMPGLPTGDMLVSQMALGGILMALYRRTITGCGDYIDMAMMDAILANMPNSMGTVFAEKQSPKPKQERIWGGAAFYRIYKTADERHVVLGGSEIKFARNLLTQLERLDLLPLCELPPGDGQRPVIDFLNDTFASQSQSYWVDYFVNLDVCFAPVNDLLTGIHLEQTRHRGMLLLDSDGHQHLGSAIKFAAEPAELNTTAPPLGGNNERILSELGISESERLALQDQGVI